MIENFFQKKAFIFDVDGTLYSQKKMRVLMMRRLLRMLVCQHGSVAVIKTIFLFRKLREKESYKCFSIDELYEEVAKRIGNDKEYVRQTINQWMFLVPLECITLCKYASVIEFINEVKKEGKTVFLYSDYPVEAKAQALGVSFDRQYTPGDGIPNELKPSKTIMNIIISELLKRGYDSEDILYVGDRAEKDGESARIVGIDYIDIREFRKVKE